MYNNGIYALQSFLNKLALPYTPSAVDQQSLRTATGQSAPYQRQLMLPAYKLHVLTTTYLNHFNLN